MLSNWSIVTRLSVSNLHIQILLCEEKIPKRFRGSNIDYRIPSKVVLHHSIHSNARLPALSIP